MSHYPQVILAPKKEESLDRFHPWVFSGAIAKKPSNLEEGQVVSVLTSDGRMIGNGHYQIGSIAVRILDFADTIIDADFLSSRLSDALKMRMALGLSTAENNTYRLVHGEGDFLPGLVVDVYGETAVVQAHSPGMHLIRNLIAQALVLLPEGGIKNVYYKSDGTLPFKADLAPENEYLIGSNTGSIAMENGLQFHVDWLRGQKTGFFIDQRDNRQLLMKYAHGRNLLNMFCYTGGFSVYGLKGGAERVVSVDSSSKAIALTEANVALNFSEEVAQRHTAVAEDAFDYLNSTEKGTFDLIILDPPAFAKHRKALQNALRGYQRLNRIAIERIAPGGIIFTFSCSQAVSREQFRLAVFSAAAQTGRRVRILHQLTQPADHPVNIYHPEGEYLKGLILYVE